MKRHVKIFSVLATLSLTLAATSYSQPILSLDFDEGSGTDVTDSAGGLTGTFGFTFDPLADSFPTWVAGPSGDAGDFALEFDGVDDLVMVDDIDNTLQLDTAAGVTYEAYVKIGGEFDGRKIVFGYGLPGGYSFSVDSDYSVFTTTYGIADIDSETAIVPNDGAWHHIAATYDGAVFSFYVDGELGGTVDYANGINSTDANRLVIGIESVNFDAGIINPFLGCIDRVKIYNSVISPDEFDIVETGGATSSLNGWELYQ